MCYVSRKSADFKKAQKEHNEILSEKIDQLKMNVKMNEKDWLLRIKRKEAQVAAIKE